MGTFYEEQLELAGPFHTKGEAYAGALTATTGWTWRYEGSLMDGENYPTMHYLLVNDTTGQRLFMAIDRHTKRVSCSPLWIKEPDGTEHGRRASLRDFLTYEQKQNYKPLDVGVSFERYLNNVGQCARRFAKYVAEPLNAYWPQVMASIASTQKGYDKQQVVADRLAERYYGEVRRQPRGNTVTVCFPGSLPTLSVRFGGRIEFYDAPTVTEAEVDALFAVRLAQEKALTP